MKKKTCCVTGHRDLPQNQINYVKAALLREIEKSVADGFTCFMSGVAEGVDQYFVEIVSPIRPVFSRVLRPCLRGAYIRILPASEMGLSCGQRAHFSALFL